MPRLPPALIRQARSENPHLTLLLRVCRDLSSARNELRWLQEHARDAVNAKRHASQGPELSHRDPNVKASNKVDSPRVRRMKDDHTQIQDRHGPALPDGGATVKVSTRVDSPIHKLRRDRTNEASHAPVFSPGIPQTKRVKLDHAEVEDSDIPTKAVSKPSVPGMYFGRQSFRKSIKGGLVRKHTVGTDIRPVRQAPSSQSQEDPTGDKMPSYTSIRNHQNPPSDNVKIERSRRIPGRININRVASGDMPAAQKAPRQTFRIRTWHDDGSREVRVHRKTGEVLPGVDLAGETRVQQLVAENVEKRSKGMPLQYIMGNQPFGLLDILCRRRVLIPRPDTEMYSNKVAELLLSALAVSNLTPQPPWQRRKKFRILDLCTGSGCIALLLHSVLKPVDADKPALPGALDIEILGIDSSAAAINLARKNLDHNISQKLLGPDALHTVSFQLMDVLALSKKTYGSQRSDDEVRLALNAAAAQVERGNPDTFSPDETWDMIIANPPYIGPRDYKVGGKTEPSVRDYEPKEALVPVGEGRFRSTKLLQADLFYLPLMRIARAVDAHLLVMEVGDSSQASRVGKQILSAVKSEVVSTPIERQLEAWRDDEAVRVLPTENLFAFDQAFDKGSSPDVSDRAVVMWSGPMAEWRRQNPPEDKLSSQQARQTPYSSKKAIANQGT